MLGFVLVLSNMSFTMSSILHSDGNISEQLLYSSNTSQWCPFKIHLPVKEEATGEDHQVRVGEVFPDLVFTSFSLHVIYNANNEHQAYKIIVR